MVRRRLVAWIGLAALTVLVGLGVSRVEVDASASPFVSTGDEVHDRLELRDDQFGADPIVVSLRADGKGIVLDANQRKDLIALEGKLSGLDDVAVVYGPGTVLNQTAKSTQNLLATITGARDGIEAQQKGEGAKGDKSDLPTVEEFDQRYGVLVAAALPVGLPTLSNEAFVANVLFDDAGDPRAQWRFLVPDAKSATILVRPRADLDRDSSARLIDAVGKAVDESGLNLASSTVSGVPVLTTEIADQAISEAPFLGALAVGAVALVLWTSRWTPRRIRRLVPVAAALLGTGAALAVWGWWGRPVSVGVAAFLPVLMGIGSDFPLYLARQRRPLRTLAVVASAALGFASLALSPLPFVRDFGLTLAGGLVVTALVGLVLARLAGIETDDEPRAEPKAEPQAELTSAPRPTWLRGALALGTLAAVAGWALLPRIDLASSPEELASGTKAIAEITELEERTGYSGDLTIMIRGKDVLDPEIVTWAVAAEAKIIEQHGAEVRPLLTVRQLFRAAGADATTEQISALAEILPAYLVGGVVNSEHTVAALNYGITLDDVRDQQALLADLDTILDDAPDGYDVGFTGLPAVAASSLHALDGGRYLVNLAGILACSLAVGYLLSWRRGLATGLSAVLAGGWVFLAAWLLGGTLNPLSVVAGALVTVTAVEFTAMLAVRRDGNRVFSRTVFTAALAGAVGYAALAASDMAVLRSFGLLLAGGVVASFLASHLSVRALGVGIEPLREWSKPDDPVQKSQPRSRRARQRTPEKGDPRAKEYVA